jgi:two-component system, chemotaxis family, chemotaxis protein CheY
MGKKVMVVDDSTAIRQVIGHVLSSEGYEVIEAQDGRDALEKLNGREVDMFICDVNMPNMDGVTFLKKVKSDEGLASYRFAPFIMLTTESGEDRIAEGKEAGAKVWLVKPFQPQKFLETVKKLMPQ